ncbi:hypothetical protein L7F22_034944 [Adiantum nelumboides]|nr:hypothetical protein [Adiantum nelumboides]
MLLAGKHKTSLDALKRKLNSAFARKDLGDAEHILGMRIKRDRKLKLLFLSQEKYIAKVLDRFNMADAKPLGVPLPPYTKLSKADCPKDEVALKATKGIPGKAHWEAVKCILRYLQDMAGDMDTKKSTNGYVFAIAGGAVAWCSRLQKIVAMSTTKAENISTTEASKEAIW